MSRPEVLDIEMSRYLAGLPVCQLLIGNRMRDVVYPTYLLAEDRDVIVAAFTKKVD